jgi:eukaryotic-like serine/threonine-protein kinase
MNERTLAHGQAPPALTTTDPLAAQEFGDYRLERRLGEGGMAEVWLADQTAPVRRQVAIKLIKAGMDSRRVLARFEAERQALALMVHPAIAKVYDGGSTPTGRPYFVMEYVEGVPLTAHCDGERLTLRERLGLFVQVCEGVQHAHQKAIIHRDLKPSNVLVAMVDGKPLPKIIDFGIAKALDRRLVEQPLSTELGALVGTPEYMSPEQADPATEDIDTRADVYSLGAMLYELLSGELPFTSRELRGASLDELRRKIREVDPLAPSVRAARLGRGALATAQGRRTAADALSRELRGDLDAIAMKALEKERSRRYGSAAELAADVGRYLRTEPVVARRAGPAYRLRKFVRRHRAGVAAGTAAALVLPALTVSLAVQVRQVSRERDRANREAEASRRVADFMTTMFKVSDPSEARGKAITAREILDQATADIETGLSGDPALRSRLAGTMGSVYTSLGLYAKARPLLEQALAQRRATLGPEAPETLESMRDIGRLLKREGRFAEAEKLLRETVDLQGRVLGPGRPETAFSMFELADTLRSLGRFPEAEKILREVIDVERPALGPEHKRTLESMSALAGSIARQGRWSEAEQLYRETLAIAERVFAKDSPETLQMLGSLAWTLNFQGRPAEAEKVTREVVERQRRVLGPDHAVTLSSMGKLGFLLKKLGRLQEAESVLRETLDARRRLLGPDHPDTVDSMEVLALVLKDERRYDEAGALLRRAINVGGRLLGPEHETMALLKYNLACTLALSGRPDEAVASLREALMAKGFPRHALSAVEQEPEFKALYGDPRFETLVAEARKGMAK